MLKLSNVSKFYYNKGIVSTGFSKINVEFNVGEFVAITGASGSGKSTLLNVISGLDSYEEGEMYINGEETSYYTEDLFEEYRKKYVANIFQDFNLINSYTVYQNIELMFLMNNIKDKSRIDELIKQVGLTKYKNTLVSKLSGGQKQRVAIARSLAKDTPIIVADEPTGNLDSKNAKEIMKLLYEVSRDKLVIIVTHNYDQVSEYATRKIKMNDGKIVEDIILSKTNKKKYSLHDFGYITFLNKLKLSLRNTFNIIPKFLLLLIVYTFLCFAVIGEYTSSKNSKYENGLFGYNSYFTNTDDNRIIIKKNDGSVITTEDFAELYNLNNISKIVIDDIFLDTKFSIENGDLYLGSGVIKNINDIDSSIYNGKLPTNDHEIIISISKNNYYGDTDLVGLTFELINEYSYETFSNDKYAIVGIIYTDDDYYSDINIYMNDDGISFIRKNINSIYSSMLVKLNDNKIYDDTYGKMVYPSNKVASGYAVVDESLSYNCRYNYYCKDNSVYIKIKNIYYAKDLNLKVSNTYNKNNIEKLTGYQNYDNNSNCIFINSDDYYSLFNSESYQASVFVDDIKLIDNTINDLNNKGYTTLEIKSTIVDLLKDLRAFVNIFTYAGIVIALVALFFISYFIIKIIFKSRNTYFSTVRIVGARKKDIKQMINMELLTVLNISYILILIFIFLVSNNILNIDYVKNLISYLKIIDYIILYIILFIMSILISNKYSKSLFKSSAMKVYRGEI